MVTFHVREATDFATASLGLIGVKKPYPLLLKTRFGIHTFGVRFPIDVLILNPQYRVMKQKKSLLPKRVFFWPMQYNLVLELPSGTIETENISLGDTVHCIT